MMMAKDDEGSSRLMDGLFAAGDDRLNGLFDDASMKIVDDLFSGNDECDDVSIDLDSFWKVMEEPTEPSQDNMLKDLPFINYLKGLQNSKEVPLPIADIPGVDMLSPSHNSEASDCGTGCSDGLSESAGTSVAEDSKRLEPSLQLSFAGSGHSYTHTGGGSRILPSYCQNNSEKASSEIPNHCGTLSSYSGNHVIHDRESSENCHLNHEEDLPGCSEVNAHSANLYHQIFMENINLGTHIPQVEGASTIDGERTSQDSTNTDTGLYPFSSDDLSYFTSGLESLACDGDKMVNIMDEGKNSNGDYISMIPYEDLLANEFEQHIAKCGSGSSLSLNGQVGVNKYNDMHAIGIESKKLFPNTLSNVFSKIQNDVKVTKKTESITSNEIVSRASEVIDDIISRKYYGNSGMVGEIPIRRSAMGARDWHPVLQVSGQTGMLPLPSIKKMENEIPNFNGYRLPNITYQGGQSNMLDQNNLDDDSDLCILEELSAPARQNPTALNSKLVAASQFLKSRDPIGHTVMGHSRLKSNDERVIFRVAVQDLSQPKSEANPPDGVLAVPLLKHQRIALSWMINKETKSVCCSGGILADDQGLGKTVSTIALILKERSPSAKVPKASNEQNEAEMLDLDEDDETTEIYQLKEPHEDNCGNTFLQTKGRPAAGTLIVCPTSVLRQWSEELTNKVTKEADLSVLVYHGSNRTKDPLELAKYDVVITTYAIVSMEVPKQPVVDENDDQIGTPFKGYLSSKKRKLAETAPGKKSSTSKKSKQGIDNELFETISGPLAKVGWFRVVLDEAQSIKNHRTQVARACWGLRAKRRWCLSGTPIQNTIDDLYSYFRFLRHEPYAIFKTFCEQLKAPIHKNPKDGYKKLQAVLKTIMLRRTKGTFLDGEPIINLPPKTIELKKVDFSKEERDFYCRLEADSRAQFAEYAAAGTVKQNYVNILLMLLRLRQACDHPLLVKGFNSNAQITSSIEMAKTLPREKHIFLLNCLEASLAICGICSDPPEDAVVTVCGHVFCNQCICEHMIADDIQCPIKNCRTHLTMSHVFSISTLRGALSDQQCVENTPNGSSSELAKVPEPRSLSCPHGSSKIKAALELLLSLSKPQLSASRTSSTEASDGYHGTEMLRGCDSGMKNGISFMETENDSVKVVGEKAIVFSQWTRMLDLLEGFLKNSSIQYRRLDGTMPVVARDRAVKDFNSLPQVSVMIMSLKAASLGLNMVAACNVILLDLWWNPTTEDQAIDRAHRIGQTRPVSVFRLTVKDTVEDRILALQQRKREMVASAFGEDGTGSRQSRLTVEDLKYLFRAD